MLSEIYKKRDHVAYPKLGSAENSAKHIKKMAFGRVGKGHS